MAKTIKRICIECGNHFLADPKEVNRGGGRFCSRGCSAAHGNRLRSEGNSSSNARRIARDVYIEHYGEPACIVCGSIPADVHHKDEDMTNNNPSNLEAICRSSHSRFHWMRRDGSVDAGVSPAEVIECRP